MIYLQVRSRQKITLFGISRYSDLERSNVGILKIETAKERLVEFVEAINDIPGMYQRCKVSERTTPLVLCYHLDYLKTNSSVL
jgi:hypothetical protein